MALIQWEIWACFAAIRRSGLLGLWESMAPAMCSSCQSFQSLLDQLGFGSAQFFHGQELVQSTGLIRRRIKDMFNDHCQAGFDPSGLQRDATDMPSRNGCTPRCTRVLRSFMWLAPKCRTSTAVQKGALLTLHTASRGGKRKKVKPSTAEESNIDWLNSDLHSNLTKQIEFSHKHNLSLNNLLDKTTLVRYSICNLNWQNFTFHTLVLIKQTGKTSFSWSEFHKIVWQNFIRTSHFLQFNLSGINPDKAKFTVWSDRD